MPDGTVLALEPLEARLYVDGCNNALGRAYVYEKTRIKLDESDQII